MIDQLLSASVIAPTRATPVTSAPLIGFDAIPMRRYDSELGSITRPSGDGERHCVLAEAQETPSGTAEGAVS